MILIFSQLALYSLAQKGSSCSCEALIDPAFKGTVAVYDRPNGTKVGAAKHDLEQQDYLSLFIDQDSAGFFHARISKSIDNSLHLSGWIRKGNYLGVFARNYSAKAVLKLYDTPAVNGSVATVIRAYDPSLYQVRRCSGKWLYVFRETAGRRRAGWLQPDMQCANPYTTCN